MTEGSEMEMLKRVCSVLFLLALTPRAVHGASFTIFNSNQITGISADGSVVTGTSYDTNHAAIWTVSGGQITGQIDLGVLSTTEPHVFSVPHAISADGTTVVGYANVPDGSAAFRWTAEDGMVSLGDFPGGALFSQAIGVSADGTIIVGGGTSASGPEAFLWTADRGLVSLGDLPGGSFSSGATDISFDGLVIVGGSASANGSEAFRWTAEAGMVGLGDFPAGAFESNAHGISGDGLTIVGYGRLATRNQAMRWTAETGIVSLGPFPGHTGTSSLARAASADGAVIVGTALQFLPEEFQGAFVWSSATGMRSISDVLESSGITLDDIELIDAVSISADGHSIGGLAYIPSTGRTVAWLAVLPDVPSAITMATVVVGLLLARGRVLDRRPRSSVASPGC